MTVTALSIRNPLSYLVCAGLKDVENRSWSTEFRGRVFIHSSGPESWDGFFPAEGEPIRVYDELERFMRLPEFQRARERGRYWRADEEGRFVLDTTYAFGDYEAKQVEFIDRIFRERAAGHVAFLNAAIVGSVELVDVVERYDSPWRTDERYAWVLRNPVLFDEPVTGVKGKLRFFEVEVPDALVR